MIYFDNAATTLVKPSGVAEAVVSALGSFGGVGRGVHEASCAAGMTVYEVRTQIAKLLGVSSAARVAFTSNATEALNIAISGLLSPGDHAITTAASHNSVLRPLYRKQKQGCDLSIVPIAPDGSVDYDALTLLMREHTKLVVVTHASNLTGDIYDIERIAHLCHERGVLCLVDAAQTAGVIPIDMGKSEIDVLAFTGHKSLFGPQGTGGLCVAEGIDIPPLKVGGTGAHSYDTEHPKDMPESLEAGTLNSHGLAGLSAGITYIEQAGLDSLAHRMREITQRFEKGALAIEGVRVYGGHAGIDRCGIVSLNIDDLDSAALSDCLNTDYGICTRSGAHCAPLMHEALQTMDQGAVRFSFSSFNTKEEVDSALTALREIAEGCEGSA